MDKTLPVVGYARVSTHSGEQLAALETQEERLKAAGVDRIITDVQSGRDNGRAGYMELCDLIARRQINAVVVTRIDRLGRTAADCDALIAYAVKHGIELRALNGGSIESASPYGFAMSRTMTTMAELESRMLSLRIRSALEQKRLTGAPLRGRAPWGYRISADRLHFEPDPVEWPRARRFIDSLEDHGYRMSTTLRTWQAAGQGPIPLSCTAAVRQWLMNPVLRGGIGYKRIKAHFTEVVWSQHEALITEHEYETVIRRHENASRMWGANVNHAPRLLTGLCRCAHCRTKMPYISGRKIPSLFCKTYGCPAHYKTIHASDIVAEINKALSARAADLAAAVAQESPEALALKRSIEELESRHDPDLAPAIAIKRQKMQNLHNAPAPDQSLLAALRNPSFWGHATETELREVYVDLVQEVTVLDQKVQAVELRL